jgi:uncharacterized protein YegP (UPF0339 family)
MTRTLFVTLLLVSLFGCALDQRTPVEVGDSAAAVSGRPYFELWESDGGQHYFHFVAANHEIILASEGYSSRSSAFAGILSVWDNGENAGRFDVKQAVSGAHYFTLKAANGRVIGVSEMYGTRSGALRGVDTVIANVGRYLEWQAERTGRRFDVFQGADERYYFNLRAGNGEIVLSSQGYTTEAAAWAGVFSVADNGIDAEQYELRESVDGGWYFNLEAKNGRVIATSEVYASHYNAERARDAVVELLPEVELL